MTKKVTTHEAKTHLSKLIDAVLSGEEVVVCRGESPLVKIVKYKGVSKSKRPKIGQITSKPITYTSDAFAPMEDEKELAEWGLA